MTAQTSAIPQVALDNHDALRWIARHGAPESLTALAATLGRDKSNLSKSLKKLAEAGVLAEEPPLAVTDAGRRVLQALDLASGQLALPESFVVLTHDRLAPDPNNPRRTFAVGPLLELEDSIVDAGRLFQNLGVRPPAEEGGAFRIKYGERRWRAIGDAIAKGRLPADFPIPVEVQDADDLTTLKEAIAENDQREGLNRIERAKAYESLATGDPETGHEPMDNAAIAALVKRTPEFVQQHRRLLRLPDDVQAMVAEDKLALHEALKLVPTAKKAAAAERAWEPKPAHVLVLVEVADKIVRKPHPIFANSTHAGRSAQHDKTLSELIREGFAGWAGVPAGTRVWLSDTALSWLGDAGLDPFGNTAALFQARQRAGLAVPIIKELESAGRYAEDWLNIAEPRTESPQSATAPEPPPPTAPAPTLRPGLTGDDFSRQLRAVRDGDEGEPADKFRGVAAVDAGEPEAQAPTPEQLDIEDAAGGPKPSEATVLQRAENTILQLATRAMEYFRRDQTKAAAGFSQAMEEPLDDLGFGIASAMKNGAMPGLILGLAVLEKRVPDVSERVRIMADGFQAYTEFAATQGQDRPLVMLRIGDVVRTAQGARYCLTGHGAGGSGLIGDGLRKDGQRTGHKKPLTLADVASVER